MNIPQLLNFSYQSNQDKVFLYFEQQQITYKTFLDNVYRTANWFHHLGIKKGDRVCVSLPNCPEFLYIWLGLSHTGGITVPINISYKERESKYILRHSECVALVGNKETLAVTDKVRPDLHNLKYVICSEGETTNPEMLDFSSFEEERPRLEEFSDVNEDDVSTIMYTSGTTGTPKGVMVTHRAYVCCGQGFTYWADITDQDRLFTCLPLYHANAQYYSTMGSLAARASLILVNRIAIHR